MRPSVFGFAILVVLALVMCESKGSHSDEGGARWAHLASVESTSPEEAAKASASHAIKTVFVLVMENQDWHDIHHNPSAPYINDTLLRIGAHAERYTTPIHPSEPNYIWLEAGDDLSISDGDDPEENYRTTRVHLTRQLETAGISWKSYQESIAAGRCPLVSRGLYAAKHNPMVFFDDVTDGRNSNSAHCVEHVRPYEELERDLTAGNVARYNFITPNLCNDMHDTGGCESRNAIANGDRWLSREVPKILASEAYRQGGALFIVWDESEDRDANPPIGFIALSPFVKPGYVGTLPYSHSSLVRTLQDVFAVRPYLRNATDAVPVDDLFEHFP
jgi:phosphatidylinositol-3-phosphatase